MLTIWDVAQCTAMPTNKTGFAKVQKTEPEQNILGGGDKKKMKFVLNKNLTR